ncbi:MAG: glucose-1-phosphate thymidylyltransferase RfbA [Novosphingobium sp.]|uniref:glucose-1-phosphate thymidylyltransferase RfbA n=1 Tax=Novosphingobium sp. TaxID=1874826 RepID=UPI0017C1BDE9|nr:glucose-1-phosphate thymidylyltransferase RfbA [Novosphingobium sp.]
MKGIVLAGGAGTRLHPITRGTSKQLLPVYDKPMVFYPISVLMLSGIRDVLVITDPVYHDNYRRLLGDGSELGMRFSYAVQPEPKGLAQAFLIGEEHVAGEPSCLVLGDNIFYGQGLSPLLKSAAQTREGAVVFAQQVRDPHAYGIVEFDADHRAVSIEEKPVHPRSNYAVTGLYYYDNQVCQFARAVKPSSRGELEITAINQMYLEAGQLKVELLGRGFCWLDTGTIDNLHAAASFVQTIEQQQGFKIACLEEIAFLNGWIDKAQLLDLAGRCHYGDYLRLVAETPR